MKKAAYNILPRTEDILKTMGEQIKLARLRRSLPAELVAERAGITKSEAESYAEEILATVKQNWERIARLWTDMQTNRRNETCIQCLL